MTSLPSLRWKLARLVLACALPTLIGFSLLVAHFYDRERSAIQRGALATADALMLAVDRDINTTKMVAIALSHSPHLSSENFSAFHTEASRVLVDEFPGMNVALFDKNHQQVLNTLRPFGPPTEVKAAGTALEKIFQSEKPTVTDLFVGDVAQRNLIAAHVPVMIQGQMRYALSIGVLPERIGEVLTTRRLASNRVVAILDGAGYIVARSSNAERFVGKRVRNELLQSIRNNSSQVIESTTLDGIPVYSMFSRSPVTGWTVVVAVPRSAILSELLGSIFWIALSVCTLLLSGFWLAFWLAQRIGNNVSGLTRAVLAMGRRKPIVLPRALFREAAVASESLLEVERELSQHRHSLEQTIAERTAEVVTVNALLRQSESLATANALRIRTVLEIVGEGIITLDETGIIQSFNRAACEIFGYSAAEIVGENIEKLMPGELRAAHREGMRRFGEGGPPQVIGKGFIELAGLHKAGRIFALELSVNVIDIDDRNLFVGIVRDITLQKAAQEKLRAATEQAQLANNAKSLFLANMSHELRTPMNAVLGMAHLLGRTRLTAEQRNDLTMIQSAGKSLLALLNNILDFSKIEAGKVGISYSEFDLDEVLKRLAAIMGVSAANQDIELIVGVEPDVPRCLIGDPLRLEQVLINLAGNAIKFTQRGEVAVLIEKTTALDDRVNLRFVVRDTGIGISNEEKERLFAPFAQADHSTARRFGGTGLGLTISKGLVELMGGKIETESEPGRGSTFKFEIPFEIGTTAKAATNQNHGLGELRVLVIDDNDTARIFLTKTILGWGWAANSVASWQAASQELAVSEGARPYDVLMVDQQLYDTGGIPIISAIRAGLDCREIPIIGMAGPYSKTIETDPQAHGDVTLTKPVTPSSVFDAVQNIFQSHDYISKRKRVSNSSEQLKGARILLVEDNAINQTVASRMLEFAGAVVDVAGNGKEAIDVLKRSGEEFDVVLMDVQMPIMDGFAATRFIRDELKLNLPILAMTAGVMESEKQQCLDCGMDDFIAKPVDSEKMLALIEHYVHARTAAGRARQSRTSSSDEATALSLFDPSKLLAVGNANDQQLEMTLDLIKKIVDSSVVAMGEARTAWTKGQFSELKTMLHSMRGVFGTLGTQRFVNASIVLEEALHSSTSLSDEMFQVFDEVYKSTLEHARHWLSSYGQSARASGGKLLRHEDLEELSTMLGRQNIDACDCFAMLKTEIAVKMSEADFHALSRAMDRLDFGIAKMFIDGLMTHSSKVES